MRARTSFQPSPQEYTPTTAHESKGHGTSIRSTLFRSGPSMTQHLLPHLRPERPIIAPVWEDDAAADQELRKKLAAISTSFAALAKQVDEDARRRKELEASRCQELVAFLGKLEHELMEESQHREEELTDFRQAMNRRLADIIEGLQERLSERFTSLFSTVDSLTDRCCTLELGIQQFKGEVPSQLQVELSSLKEQMKHLIDDFKDEQKRAETQEDALLQRIEEVGFGVDAEMQKELARLERRGEALQELIDQLASPHENAETAQIRALTLQRVAEVRQELQKEATLREAADDEVWQAINHYRATLHRSLSAN
ncbi:unnamed protein product [Durusdinium trenchii]|uniref:Uncharacterized protein n=2 Tax=Durusdinium trenchii TaxID=1381693 RepID=A0ABP0J6D9_9DINO